MEFRRVAALRGPNIWANFPVLEVWVDLKELKDSPSDSLPGFNERLMSWLPSMIEHRCSIGERGGFFERLRRGTWQGHILEHTTIELQNLTGKIVGFGKARETSEDGVYKVVIEYDNEELARECLYAARDLLHAAVYDLPYDINAELKRLREYADEVCLGPSTAAIVYAAEARKIPVRRLSSNNLVQLGYGANQHRIWTAETDQTGAVAESIAQDKELTKRMLRAAGVPVPEGRPVDSPADAWEAACEIGCPVVVKPRNANHGRGVFTRLMTQAQIESAFSHASEEGEGVLVEKFAQGAEHRLLVVDGRMVAAARGDSAAVIGDGKQTVAELVESQLNSDPRRGNIEECPLAFIEFNAKVLLILEQQGYTPESIPENEAHVLIQRNGNHSLDVTNLVHPEVAARAVAAAQVVGLDVAGLDIVMEDVSRPLEEQGGVVVEVNAGPGLHMHLKPSNGAPQPVGEAIVETLFPNGDTGLIPIVAVSGTNGKTITTCLINHILRNSRPNVGMTTSEGIFFNGRQIDSGDCSGPRSARKLLLNPRTECAVFEVGRGGVLREGLGFDRCQVAVVTNMGECDHLGMYFIDDPEVMMKVKRTPVDVILPGGYAVLNAADSLVLEMVESCKYGIIYYAIDGRLPLIMEHRRHGKIAVYVRDGNVVVAEGTQEHVLVEINNIPLTRNGTVAFQVENVLAAVAGAWAMGVSSEVIASSLLSFAGDVEQLPGRFNVWTVGDSTLILDVCNNSSALIAQIDALKTFTAESRTAVYSVEGDRRDVDIVRQGELLGAAFDRVILYEGYSTFGRPEGEIIALLRQGLATGTRVAEVLEAGSVQEAVQQSLAMLRPGELLVIRPDEIAETLEEIRHFIAGGQPDSVAGLSTRVGMQDT